jgi:hypothetical protein
MRFPRGVGVPENFIEYMGSLTGKALEFYSCFISYSARDQEFADSLYADLRLITSVTLPPIVLVRESRIVPYESG